MIFEQERVLSVLCIMAGWRDEGFHLGGDAYLLAKQQEHVFVVAVWLKICGAAASCKSSSSISSRAGAHGSSFVLKNWNDTERLAQVLLSLPTF